MSVKQFNCTYFLIDDRIIFRFNTMDHKEYKFWLTRRLTHYILNSTGQSLANQHQQQPQSVTNIISEFQQQSDKQGSNFSNAYEPGIEYPIGADAILVIDVRCKMIKVEENDVFSLDFILPGGGNINLRLPVSVMQKIILLLEELNIQAKWGNPINTFQ